jgi:hypothetical protein
MIQWFHTWIIYGFHTYVNFIWSHIFELCSSSVYFEHPDAAIFVFKDGSLPRWATQLMYGVAQLVRIMREVE